MNKKALPIYIFVVCGILAVLLPFFLPKFQLRMITEIIILALFAISWRMLFHEVGLLSFGHALYFGFGAYVSVLAWLHFNNLSFMGGILLGGVSAALLGLVLGFLMVRVSGTYFALLTLAFNSFFWAMAWKWREVTRGDDGIGGFPKPPFLGFEMNNAIAFYFVSLIIIALLMAVYWYLTKTPLGNIMTSIKSNPEKVNFLGFNVNTYKLIIFTISGFYAGISGSLYAQLQEFISTSVIDVFMSTDVLFMAYIGGTGFFWGSLVGSSILVYLTAYLGSLTERYEFFFGLIFVIIVLFMPNGIIGILKDGRNFWRARR